jgi:23S rRNA (uracil1939-C5)-methyltransferase
MSEHFIGSSFKLKIHDLSRGGSGVGRIGERVVFVPFSLPGDELEVEITRAEKRFLEGKILNIQVASPDRVPARCPVFGKCGGCTWQHVPYDQQWRTKKDGVLQALGRAGVQVQGVPLQEFPAEDSWNYRNRIQLRAENGVIGFFEKASRQLVGIEKCDVAKEEINAVLPNLGNQMELSTKRGTQKIELDVRPGAEVRIAVNQPHAAFGFRQVNDAQNEKLQQWVKESFSVRGHLLDLYGGFGNLSLPLSVQMESIDCVDVSVPDQGKSPYSHFHYSKSDVLPWLKKRLKDHEKGTLRWSLPRVTVLDPPREGLGDSGVEIVENLGELQVSQAILVGCDPDSFSRDVGRFLKSNWSLESLAVFDFFPQTPHVESAARFIRPI